MKTYGQNGSKFLTFALDGDDWSASYCGHLNSAGKRPHYPLDRRLGGWVSLDVVAKRKLPAFLLVI